ncbi:PepSY-like domain-containing protein [uncultured Flavobacterium sp.]|uniref:PepSY-like domain-containing protein n=1 Tax=uncultured Flavobacterium sp. TaxID=165435 RepID=UPI00292D03A2|nr:PepSY-like domain-containing protein [uncultured Flavobacterium sp.]
MKKLILMFAAIVMFCNCSFAMTPPKAVKGAFDKKFPTATKISWGKESAKEWEAEFTLDGIKISAVFYEDGKWLETEQEVKASALPKAVADAIKAKYPDWKIAEADKTESAKLGSIYEADLRKGMSKKSLAIKADGTFVKE